MTLATVIGAAHEAAPETFRLRRRFPRRAATLAQAVDRKLAVDVDVRIAVIVVGIVNLEVAWRIRRDRWHPHGGRCAPWHRMPACCTGIRRRRSAAPPCTAPAASSGAAAVHRRTGSTDTGGGPGRRSVCLAYRHNESGPYHSPARMTPLLINCSISAFATPSSANSSLEFSPTAGRLAARLDIRVGEANRHVHGALAAKLRVFNLNENSDGASAHRRPLHEAEARASFAQDALELQMAISERERLTSCTKI